MHTIRQRHGAMWLVAAAAAAALLAVLMLAMLAASPVGATGGDGGGYNVEVEKTVETSFTKEVTWTISKTVDPREWWLFVGDTGTSEYTVRVTKRVTSAWSVTGTITIENPGTEWATITAVTDTISGGIGADVDCEAPIPYDLAPGGTLLCQYDADLPDGTNRTNTVEVETSGAVGGNTDTESVVFGEPVWVGPQSVNVTDTFAGELGTFDSSGKATYERTFECEASTAGGYIQYDNTATIVETGQSDDAGVRVKCFDLRVKKDAEPSFDVQWRWRIAKEADRTSLMLAEGETATVDYEVTVGAASSSGNPSVSGSIWIENPNPERDATLTAVVDVISPDIPADVACPSLTVPAGGTLHCTYSADLPDDGDRRNRATATLQNHDYDAEGVGTPSGTTDFSGFAFFSFDGVQPGAATDECIEVSDTNVGILGTVCADEAPKTFMYSLTFGTGPGNDVQLECGDNRHVNTASFVTNDTGATGEDSWTVSAKVECDDGCTLTQGYWKTHSTYGPAPYDDTWAQIGEDTPFFLSGQSYYGVLWTSPAGNAYYILAHQYIAARLNMLNGASIPGPVQTAFDQATTLLGTYTPAQIAAMKGNDPVRQQFVALGGILDAYNNGRTGPGHCD